MNKDGKIVIRDQYELKLDWAEAEKEAPDDSTLDAERWWFDGTFEELNWTTLIGKKAFSHHLSSVTFHRSPKHRSCFKRLCVHSTTKTISIKHCFDQVLIFSPILFKINHKISRKSISRLNSILIIKIRLSCEPCLFNLTCKSKISHPHAAARRAPRIMLVCISGHIRY